LQSFGVAVLLLMAALGVGVASARACSNEALRAELHSMALPDCRAYELVSPFKDGLNVSASEGISGERVIASSLATFSGSDQISPFNYYEFMRGPSGWDAVPLNTPVGYFNSVTTDVQATSPDLREGVFEYTRTTSTDPRELAYYIRTIPSGLPVEIGPVFSRAALERNKVTLSPNRSATHASKDLRHVLFMLEGPTLVRGPLVNYVWPEDTTAVSPEPGLMSLYEYTGTGNSTPALVGVDESGHLIGECGTTLGYPAQGLFTSLLGDELYNAISANGSHIFFTVAAATQGPSRDACTEVGGVGVGRGPQAVELFARVDGSKTVSISEPSTGSGGDCSECHTSEPPADAVFQGASEDGSKVFYLSQQHLLPGSEGTNLYEYDFNAERGKRVVLVAPNVAGVSRVSQDGSRVYFVAKDVLTNAPNPVGSIAQSGADNLYVYERDATSPGGHIAFIGTLTSADQRDWARGDERPVDATPDGRFVVFTSSAKLTPDDTSNMPQVFEYDAQAQTLVLISHAAGDFEGAGAEFEAAIAYPNYADSTYPAPTPQPSSVSDNGAYVVFETSAGLMPQAVAGYPNVYEYHAGRLSLISDGQDRSVLQEGTPTTRLLGIDGSGANVFFTTGDQLVPQDGDTQEDVYDARIGGGFLPPRLAVCEGEGCQGTSISSPLFVPPSSASQAPGDQVVEPPVKPVVKSKTKRKIRKAKHRRKARKAGRRSNKLANRSKRR
jgi:hypothetical protein